MQKKNLIILIIGIVLIATLLSGCAQKSQNDTTTLGNQTSGNQTSNNSSQSNSSGGQASNNSSSNGSSNGNNSGNNTNPGNNSGNNSWNNSGNSSGNQSNTTRRKLGEPVTLIPPESCIVADRKDDMVIQLWINPRGSLIEPFTEAGKK